MITSAIFVIDPTNQFTDFISPQFVIVGPGSPVVTQAFDLGLQQGVGSYMSPSLTPVGALLAGSIELTYDLYTVSPNDPSFDAGADLEASGRTVSADASINVVAAPEPGFVVLWATMLAIITIRYGRKPSRSDVREMARPFGA